MKSVIIAGMLREELERNQRMTNRYQAELNTLPKGTIVKRTIKKEEYCYLSYRENGKVVSKYLGKTSIIDLDSLEKSLQERKRIANILKKLKTEEKELRKILR